MLKPINFKGRHFSPDIILMAVRWYLAYALSYRDIEELMLERGISGDHSTIHRWVVKYDPQLENVFRKKYKRKPGVSWREDETYIKVKRKWYYLYRAVDKEGYTVDFILLEKRDKKAAIEFFLKSIGDGGLPEKVTIDKIGSNKAALDFINLILYLGGFYEWMIEIRQIKYLNNIVEQDHRFVKKITKPMMGFKEVKAASATLVGIELWRMLKKRQHVYAGNMSIFEQFYTLAA